MNKQKKNHIRKLREKICFSVCDRAAWFYSLTEWQKKNIIEWRNAWLDAPETGICPATPSWVK